MRRTIPCSDDHSLTEEPPDPYGDDRPEPVREHCAKCGRSDVPLFREYHGPGFRQVEALCRPCLPPAEPF